MRIAYLADIHANLEALRACLASARERGADRLIFLGDIVGYGADPAACLDLVREACEAGAAAVIGNHDEAVACRRIRMSPIAEIAARWTETMLNSEHKLFLAGLPLTLTEDDRLYVHASALTPERYPYIRDVQAASDSLRATAARMTVCGHVHVNALYHISIAGKVMGFKPGDDVSIPLSQNRRWLVVLGSVGQPRDGNPASVYGLLETATNEFTFVRVPYDIETAAFKIRGAGLPEALWKRLSLGR